RIIAPPGVPGPVRVRSSLSVVLSIAASPTAPPRIRPRRRRRPLDRRGLRRVKRNNGRDAMRGYRREGAWPRPLEPQFLSLIRRALENDPPLLPLLSPPRGKLGSFCNFNICRGPNRPGCSTASCLEHIGNKSKENRAARQ